MPEVALPSDTEFYPGPETVKYVPETSNTAGTDFGGVTNSQFAEARNPRLSPEPEASRQSSETALTRQTTASTTPATTPETTPFNVSTPVGSSRDKSRDPEREVQTAPGELGIAEPLTDEARLQKLEKLQTDVEELFFSMSGKEWQRLRENGIMPPVKVVTAETDADSICENLKVLPLQLPPHWGANDHIRDMQFDSIEKAVYWATEHASTRHYQLVPRYDEKGDIWTLHCDRKAADDLDKLVEEQYEARVRRNHETELNYDSWYDDSIPHKKCECKIERGTPRKNCNFKMTIVRGRDALGDNCFVLKQAPGESSVHNHKPSVDISAHEFDNPVLYRILSYPEYTNDTLHKEEQKRTNRLRIESNIFLSSSKMSKIVHNDLNRLKQQRRANRNPFEVTRELFSNPLLRGAVQRDGLTDKSIFFAHTQGLMWWRAFPEVVIIDSKWEKKLRESSYYRAVSIRCVSSQNEEIPICVCLTEKTGVDIEESTWSWILEEYKKLLEEFQIPLPSFIQTDSDDNLLAACRTAIPTVMVQLEGKKRIDKSAQMHAKLHTSNGSQRKKAVTKWEQIVNAPDVTTMSALLETAKQWKMELFENLERHLLQHTSQAIKNAGKHFHVMPTEKTRVGFLVEKPLNILELVRDILKDIVDSYELLTVNQAQLYAYTEPGYDDDGFYDDVLHLISYLALKRVRNADPSVLNSPCQCSTQGCPCAHEIREIKRRGRRLGVDDFHPHWRNIFADLHTYHLCMGKYFREWAQIETGPWKFFPKMDEEERAAKRARLE